MSCVLIPSNLPVRRNHRSLWQASYRWLWRQRKEILNGRHHGAGTGNSPRDGSRGQQPRARKVRRTPGRAPGTTVGRWFVTRAQISERRGLSGVTSPGKDYADGAFGPGRADRPLAFGQFAVLAVLRPGKPQPSAGPGVALGIACDGRCPSVPDAHEPGLGQGVKRVPDGARFQSLELG